MQLGHLFKISGNLAAAKRAYRRAAREERSGALELESFDRLTSDALNFDRGLGIGGGDTVSLDAFWAVFSCELNEKLDYPTLDRAANALAAHGQTDLAKAFWEVAFLSDEKGRYRRQQLACAQRFRLWPLAQLSKLVQTQSVKTAPHPVESYRRLRALANAALSGESRDDDRPLASSDATRSRLWPPAVLTIEEAAKLAPQLCASVDRAHQRLLHGDAGLGEERDLAMRDLALSATPLVDVVTFPRARDVENFRLVAVRVLRTQIEKLLARNERRYLGPRGDPGVIAALIALEGNPLAERFAELRSAPRVFFEVDAVLKCLASESSSGGIDAAFARLTSACSSGLTHEEARSLFEETTKYGYLATSVVLVRRLLAEGQALENDVVDIARKLKIAGGAALAVSLFANELDEARMSDAALIENAIVAKIAGDFATAARLLESCAAGSVDSVFVRRELAAILPEIEAIPSILERFRDDPLFMEAAREKACYRLALGEESIDIGKVVVADPFRVVDLAPEIASEFLPAPTGEQNREEIQILQAGWREAQGVSGPLVVLRAVDFVRARVTSRVPILNMRARIDGKTIAMATPSLLPADGPDPSLSAWICNCWMDLSQVTPGRHALQLYFEECGGGHRSIERLVWVDSNDRIASERPSAAIVELPDETRDLPLDERINALPSLILPAQRTLFAAPLRRILVVRADRLGDVALSLPAMFALKRHFPDAKLYCLAAPSNHELLASTGLFEDLFAVELEYDPRTRLSAVSLADQANLKERLARMGFDLAIDLAAGSGSRPLLRLANARYTAGYNPGEFRWLSFGLSLATRDPGNKREGSPHSVRPLALVDALASVVAHQGFRLPNAAVDVEFLRQRGLDGKNKFAVLHCGARTASRKWPAANFVALANRIVRELRLRVVLFADSPEEVADAVAAPSRAADFQVIAERLSFSSFDTLLSKCAVFVGNDTGPKHLAALRGAPVVSLHMGAVNWREWAQEDSGVVVTRRVPCYGCGIEEIAECGKGLACLMNISVDEAFEAVRRAMRGATAHA
jgi:ADP-heptose:LPS heptosyltransferase